MIVNLKQVYSELKAWRNENGFTVKSQRPDYFTNAMKVFDVMLAAIKNYEKCSQPDCGYSEEDKQICEYIIINTICVIAIMTINTRAQNRIHHPDIVIDSNIMIEKTRGVYALVGNCSWYCYHMIDIPEEDPWIFFRNILRHCIEFCKHYGFNFEIAMLETIKELRSSQDNFYKANYELARL